MTGVQRDIIITGDCVPYGVRVGVTAEQTFAALIAAMRGATYRNCAYYYGTVGPRPHTSPGGAQGINANTGLPNNVLDQLEFILGHDPQWLCDMSGEASIYRIGGANGTPAEPAEIYRANLIALAQRWALAGKWPERLVLMDIVPQVLVEPASNELYYKTDVLTYNAIRHEVAKTHGNTVVYLHDHMLAAWYSMPDLGASHMDPSGDPQNPDHHHNHLQAPGHAFVAGLLARPQYSHLFRVANAAPIPVPQPDGWTLSAGPVAWDAPPGSGGWNTGTGYTIIQTIEAAKLSANGNEIRVTFASGFDQGLAIAGAWVGSLDGVHGTVGAPTALGFGGQASASIPAGGEAAGSATFTRAAGKGLYVAIYIAPGGSAGMTRRRVAAQDGWKPYYTVGNVGGAPAASGYTASNNTVDAVSRVEVK